MSQENVELARRAAEAMNARMIPDSMAADFRLENVNTAVTDKTYIGASGMREWMHDMFGAFAEGAEFRLDEVIADSDDWVVAITSLVGRGAASDAPMQLRWANVVWFSGGQMVRSEGFRTRREALKAVGLVE